MLIGALAFYFGLQSEMLAQKSKIDFMHNKNYGSQLGVLIPRRVSRLGDSAEQRG